MVRLAGRLTIEFSGRPRPLKHAGEMTRIVAGRRSPAAVHFMVNRPAATTSYATAQIQGPLLRALAMGLLVAPLTSGPPTLNEGVLRPAAPGSCRHRCSGAMHD